MSLDINEEDLAALCLDDTRNHTDTYIEGCGIEANDCTNESDGGYSATMCESTTCSNSPTRYPNLTNREDDTDMAGNDYRAPTSPHYYRARMGFHNAFRSVDHVTDVLRNGRAEDPFLFALSYYSKQQPIPDGLEDFVISWDGVLYTAGLAKLLLEKLNPECFISTMLGLLSIYRVRNRGEPFVPIDDSSDYISDLPRLADIMNVNYNGRLLERCVFTLRDVCTFLNSEVRCLLPVQPDMATPKTRAALRLEIYCSARASKPYSHQGAQNAVLALLELATE